jgi:DNA-binding NtrC family response regulator
VVFKRRSHALRHQRAGAKIMSGTPTLGADHLDVLVVDDEPNVASSTADVLRLAGFNVATAATVEEALQLIATREVRSVILDHHIAGEEGGGFLDQSRELPSIIVMSGWDRSVLAEFQDAHGEQLFACLAKPVRAPDLIDVITAAVGDRHS